MGDIFGGGGGGADIQQVPTKRPGQINLLDALTSLLSGQIGQGITHGILHRSESVTAVVAAAPWYFR